MNMLLTDGSAAGTGTVMVVYIILIVAFIYFMMIRPQNKEKENSFYDVIDGNRGWRLDDKRFTVS